MLTAPCYAKPHRTIRATLSCVNVATATRTAPVESGDQISVERRSPVKAAPAVIAVLITLEVLRTLMAAQW